MQSRLGDQFCASRVPLAQPVTRRHRAEPLQLRGTSEMPNVDDKSEPLLDPLQGSVIEDGDNRVRRADTFDNEYGDDGNPVPLQRMNTYDVPPPKPNSGNSTLFQLIMNFINTVVGAGIVGLPFVFKLCGFYLGLIELLVICLITAYVL